MLGEILDFGSPWRPYRISVRQILSGIVLLVINGHTYQVWWSVDDWCAWKEAPNTAHLVKIMNFEIFSHIGRGPLPINI